MSTHRCQLDELVGAIPENVSADDAMPVGPLRPHHHLQKAIQVSGKAATGAIFEVGNAFYDCVR